MITTIDTERAEVTVQDEGGVDDVVTLCAALLHDTVEDTDTSPQELAEVFGLQLAEVGGDIHRVEQRRMRTVGHRAVIMVTAETVERKGA